MTPDFSSPEKSVTTSAHHRVRVTITPSTPKTRPNSEQMGRLSVIVVNGIPTPGGEPLS